MYCENKRHVKKVSLLWSNKLNPANISCSESLTVTLEKVLKSMFKINNKDTRTTSLTRFWCRYFYPRTYFQLFLTRSSVSIVDFEHVHIYWEQPQLNTLFFQNLFYNFWFLEVFIAFKFVSLKSLWGLK